jgi:hypothetical protein
MSHRLSDYPLGSLCSFVNSHDPPIRIPNPYQPAVLPLRLSDVNRITITIFHL